MTTEVIHFPAGIYPSVQRLSPDVGPGQSVTESPFTGAQTVNTFRGAERWRLELQLEDLTGDDRAEMMAFVTRLRVAHNTFIIINHTNPQRGQAFLWATANCFQMNTNSTGSSHGRIWFANAGVSPTSLIPFKAGDFFSVNSMLKMTLVDMPPLDGGHIGSVYFWPPLFANVTSGTRAQVYSACGGFRMISAVPITTDPPLYRTSLSISAIERVNSSYVSGFL